MNSDNLTLERIVALAGLVQAVKLVKQIATKGYAQETEFKTSLFSIIQTDTKNTAEVYGDIRNIRFGLLELKTILDSKNRQKDSDIVRYLLSVLHIEKQLSKHPAMLTIIQDALANTKEQLAHTPLTDQTIVTGLAGIYQQTLSNLKFKIHVTGDSIYLTNFENLSKVRAMLLAAVRSAVLWRQIGGSKWDLIFKKKQLLIATNMLLTQLA